MDENESWLLENSVGPDPHLTQGDLVLFPDSADPLRRAGIVVTADCDLEQRKHAQLATLVPVVSVQTTMENYLFLDACEMQRKQIHAFFCRSRGFAVDEDSAVVDAEMRSFLTSPQEDQVLKLAVEFLLRTRESMSVGEYSALMKAVGSNPKGASSFEQQLLKKGDIVIVPSPKALGVDAEIVWVRHIWQEPVGQIALRTSDVAHCRGEKLARLASPYRYRLTQVMAQVFSDIGLPASGRKFLSEIEEVLSNG